MHIASYVFLCICILPVRYYLYIKIIQILSIPLQDKCYHSHIIDENNMAQNDRYLPQCYKV